VDAGDQLLEGERLHQVVVGARLEAAVPVADAIVGGEQDDRSAVAGLA